MSNVACAPTELGTLSIGKLLRMYALPGIIAQTAASLYNMVDSIFIGHIPDIGSYAISGLAVTFPLMNLSVAVGTLVGVGATSLVSVLLGQQHYGSARRVLSNVLTLNIIIGLLFSTISLIFLDPILTFFGASEKTLPFAKDYMTIILIGNAVTHLYHGFNGLIRASGSPKTAMGLTIFTVVSNAILDPILIFGFNMGIKGAALATVICQVIALCYTLFFFLNKKNFIHFEKPLFSLNKKIVKQCFSIGISPFLLNAAACLVTLFINQQLGKYGGDLAIGAFGIVNRFSMLFIMICLGVNQGLQPIAGYNFGALQYTRVRKVFYMSALLESSCTTLCFLCSILIPKLASGIFTNDPELLGIASRGLSIANLAYIGVGFSICTSTLFQSLGMVKKAIILSLTRQLLFLIPLVYLLPLHFGQLGVWISFPIGDGLSILMAYLMVSDLLKKLRQMKDGESPSQLGSAII